MSEILQPETVLIIAECKRLAEFIGSYDGDPMPMVDLENVLLDAVRLLSK